MHTNILVPLDGSPRAEFALPVAARIARATSSSLLLVQVISLPVDYSGGWAPVPMMTQEMFEADNDAVSNYLKTLVASPLLADIQTMTEVMFGTPSKNILATAASHRTDLIVICSHGRTGFMRWALGSVAHTLAHESRVPTLILRESEPASLLSGSTTAQPLCALVPLDGSQLAEAALVPAVRLIAALAAPARGALHLAQVVKVAREDDGGETYEEAMQYARTYLAHVAERLQATAVDLKLPITWSVISEKDVASALVSEAEREDSGEGPAGYALIAISTHGRSGLERWVMGSVTEHVLDATKLPMLIVRPQGVGKP